MAEKTKKLKGNGHINVSNVNSINSECILLTYTVWNFKNQKQVTEIKKGLLDIIDEDDVSFDLEVKDWTGEEEKQKLKIKVKSCNDEKRAHVIKQDLDKFIKTKGGQTTLDESLEEND